MNLEELSLEAQFSYIAMTKSAIYFKEAGFKKDDFIEFADGIWDSMEINDIESLKKTLSECMETQMDFFMDEYIKKLDKET